MPPNRFESEVESFLEGSHGDRTHIKRADHHTVTPLCGTLLWGMTDTCHPTRAFVPTLAKNLAESLCETAGTNARTSGIPHVNPIGGGLGVLPTMPPIGFSYASKG